MVRRGGGTRNPSRSRCQAVKSASTDLADSLVEAPTHLGEAGMQARADYVDLEEREALVDASGSSRPWRWLPWTRMNRPSGGVSGVGWALGMTTAGAAPVAARDGAISWSVLEASEGAPASAVGAMRKFSKMNASVIAAARTATNTSKAPVGLWPLRSLA